MVTKEQVDAAKSVEDLARSQRSKLEENFHNETTVPAMKANIGKCFKYSNSYGDGSRWWIYARIVDVVDGSYVAAQFQQDKAGKISIDPNGYGFSSYGQPEPISGWIPISIGECKRAAQKILGPASSILKF